MLDLLANGVDRVTGNMFARNQILLDIFPAFLWFRDAAGFQRHANDTGLQHDHGHLVNRLEWIAAPTSGVYLVRMCLENTDHVVCVDSNQRQILERIETYPIRSSVQELKWSAGLSTTFQRVMETRRVVRVQKIESKNQRRIKKRQSDACRRI